MSIPPTQLPQQIGSQSQQFGSHRGAGTVEGGRRTGRRTAEDAGLNPNSSSMQVESAGLSVDRRNVVGSSGQPPPLTTSVGRHGSAARFSSRDRVGSRSGNRLAGNPQAQATA